MISIIILLLSISAGTINAAEIGTHIKTQGSWDSLAEKEVWIGPEWTEGFSVNTVSGTGYNEGDYIKLEAILPPLSKGECYIHLWVMDEYDLKTYESRKDALTLLPYQEASINLSKTLCKRILVNDEVIWEAMVYGTGEWIEVKEKVDTYLKAGKENIVSFEIYCSGRVKEAIPWKMSFARAKVFTPDKIYEIKFPATSQYTLPSSEVKLGTFRSKKVCISGKNRNSIARLLRECGLENVEDKSETPSDLSSYDLVIYGGTDTMLSYFMSQIEFYLKNGGNVVLVDTDLSILPESNRGEVFSWLGVNGMAKAKGGWQLSEEAIKMGESKMLIENLVPKRRYLPLEESIVLSDITTAVPLIESFKDNSLIGMSINRYGPGKVGFLSFYNPGLISYLTRWVLDDTVYLRPVDLKGGKGPGSPYGKESVWIYAASTDVSQLEGVFNLVLQPEGIYSLCITGIHGESGNVKMKISINEKVIYTGLDEFTSDWPTVKYEIPAMVLKKGKNMFRISNLEPEGAVGAPPWLMIHEARINKSSK